MTLDEYNEAVRQIMAEQQAVAQTREVVAAAQAGDLTGHIATQDKTGPIAELCEGINALVEAMAAIIAQIKFAADTIAVGASEIAEGNSDLSVRTEQQAASLEETAVSMKGLTATVQQTATNARQASELASGAVDVAAQGGHVVHEVVCTMALINESSRRIVDIISVIDGIAFQTNILALNAAVEAARAGEQGRGFAVVAGEVRNLAQRSAAAAKEIKGLIGDSVSRVEAGSRLVDQAGRTMDEVVASVKRVSDIIGEIAAASDEQREGIEQVNGSIVQMDQVTQQNAALVEQAAAAAAAMREQAAGLAQLVDTFQLAATATTQADVPAPAQALPRPPARAHPAVDMALQRPHESLVSGLIIAPGQLVGEHMNAEPVDLRQALEQPRNIGVESERVAVEQSQRFPHRPFGARRRRRDIRRRAA